MLQQRWRVILGSLILAALLPASWAHAQLSKLDPGTLIYRLQRDGLGDLLKHLVETEGGAMKDPAFAKQALVAQMLLEYRALAEQADKGKDPEAIAQARAGALKYFNQSRDVARQLIKEHYNHEQRPMWQTDLAEQNLFEFLGRIMQNALEFNELGVPRADQAQAYHEAIVESLELLEDADVRFDQLQTELPKQPHHVTDRVDTGLWARMIEDYYKKRSQYFLVHAIYHVLHLPDTDPYFATEENPRVVRKKKTAALERQRMTALAFEKLETLMQMKSDDLEDAAAVMRSVRGRLWGISGKPTDALADLDAALKAFPNQDLMHLVTNLSKTVVLDASGQSAQALALLDELHSHPLVQANPLMKLLLIDRTHLTLLHVAQDPKLTPADKKPAAMAKAYELYLNFINAYEGDMQSALRNYVYQRWSSSIPLDADLSNIPPLVVAALAQVLRADGQNFMIDAENAPDEPAVQALQKQAKPKLERVVKIVNDLIKRSDVTPPVKAHALFDQAVAQFFLARPDPKPLLEAAATLVRIGAEFPDLPVGLEAVSNAVQGILRPLNDNRTPGAAEAYEAAAKVLLEKYPTSDTTNDERFYYSINMLIPREEWAAAAAMLNDVPATHPSFFEAHRDRLYSLWRLSQTQTDPAARDALLEKILAEAQQLRGAAEQAVDSADEKRRDMLRATIATARLLECDVYATQADLAGGSKEKFLLALAQLNNFEQDHFGQTDQIRQAMGKRIVVHLRFYLASGEAKLLADSLREAQAMMTNYPDDAAPVVDAVLTDLDRRIDQVRQQAAVELVSEKREAYKLAATNMSKAAVDLAELLVKWAKDQHLPEEQMLPFYLILAKSKRLSGSVDEAVAMLKPLTSNERFKNDAFLLMEYAEALYASGNKENLLLAAGFYNRLITGLRADDQGQYPLQFWISWTRWLQILDKLKEQTDVIPMRVAQLIGTSEKDRPKFLPPEPWLSDLKTLRNKWSK